MIYRNMKIVNKTLFFKISNDNINRILYFLKKTLDEFSTANRLRKK